MGRHSGREQRPAGVDGHRSAGRRDDAPAAGVPPVRSLQSLVGNAAVARLVRGAPARLARADAPAAQGEAGLDAAQQAEVVRLEGEIKRLAQKNAWSGVVRQVGSLEAIGLDHAKRSTHYIAAQGEKNVNGVTNRYLDFLNRVISGPASDEGDPAEIATARQMREDIFTGFREVWITPPGGAPEEDGGDRGGGLFGGMFGGGKGKDEEVERPTAELVCDPMPFAGDTRMAIEGAQRKLATDGWFKGHLPHGEYTLNGAPLVVERGASRMNVTY